MYLLMSRLVRGASLTVGLTFVGGRSTWILRLNWELGGPRAEPRAQPLRAHVPAACLVRTISLGPRWRASWHLSWALCAARESLATTSCLLRCSPSLRCSPQLERRTVPVGLTGWGMASAQPFPHRAARPGPSRQSMQQDVDAGLFLEYADVHGNMYGTSLAAVAAVGESGRIAVLDIDVQVRTEGPS
jgi:hypothetical protein